MPMIQPKFNLVQLSINDLSASNPMGGAGYLTPDALMSYCSIRLRGLDDQIQTSFAKQKTANDDSALLSQLANDIGSPGDLTLSGDVDTDQKAVVYAAADKMLAAAEKVSDPAVRAALIKAASKLAHLDKQVDANGKETYTVKHDGLVGTGGGAFGDKGSIPSSTFKGMTGDAIASIQKDLNSGTELSMINLQSLMSQRQSAVQTVTNMVQSLGDQLNKIASNIGH